MLMISLTFLSRVAGVRFSSATTCFDLATLVVAACEMVIADAIREVSGMLLQKYKELTLTPKKNTQECMDNTKFVSWIQRCFVSDEETIGNEEFISNVFTIQNEVNHRVLFSCDPSRY